LVLGSTTAQIGLVKELTVAVSKDGFLSGVLKSVNNSNDNFFRNLFLDAAGVLCYQWAEDVRSRVCVPSTCREVVLRAAHCDSVLAGHPGIDHMYAAISYAYYSPGIADDVTHFVRSCTVCAASRAEACFAWVLKFFCSTFATFYKLSYGFDWVYAYDQEGSQMDCDVGGSYFQDDCCRNTLEVRETGTVDI